MFICFAHHYPLEIPLFIQLQLYNKNHYFFYAWTSFWKTFSLVQNRERVFFRTRKRGREIKDFHFSSTFIQIIENSTVLLAKCLNYANNVPILLWRHGSKEWYFSNSRRNFCPRNEIDSNAKLGSWLLCIMELVNGVWTAERRRRKNKIRKKSAIIQIHLANDILSCLLIIIELRDKIPIHFLSFMVYVFFTYSFADACRWLML